MAKKAGTIPFQVIDGTFWICLISSKKRKGKFVLPKGSVRGSTRKSKPGGGGKKKSVGKGKGKGRS